MRLIAAVMRGECLLQARLIKRHIPMDRKPLKFDPRGKPVGGEAPGTSASRLSASSL